MIQHNKPYFDIADKNIVAAVLQSGYVAQGEEVEYFEHELSSYVKCGHSILVNSGTTALYLALYALRVSKGDEVILPTYVCSALLNSIYMIGAIPKIVDVNEDDFNIDWKEVDIKLNSRTKAIMVPHIHGMPSFVPSEKYNGVPIIEDCATALGSKVHLRGGGILHVGNIADISVMSFYATKFCAMGYGGFVMTKNKELADRVIGYREFDCVEEYHPRFNFQVSDLNAGLGRSQLRKVDAFLERRKQIAARYDDVFNQKGIERQTSMIDCQYNNYRYIIRLKEAEVNKLSTYLYNKGIKTIIPIETYELLHNYLKLSPTSCPVAEKIAKTTLSMPIYPALKDDEIEYIVNTIKEY